jgi:beta-lactamase class A
MACATAWFNRSGLRRFPLLADERMQAALAAIETDFDLTLGVFARPLGRAGEAVSFNARTVFPAASTIKLFILAALLDEVAAGRQQLEGEVRLMPGDKVAGSGVLKNLQGDSWLVRDLAMLMIIVSDNTATNLLIDLLGVELIRDYCARHGWADTSLVGRLMVANRKVSSTTSPRDLADCMSRLWSGELLPAGQTRVAREILLAQQYTDQLGREVAFDGYSSETGEDDLLIASKSGSIRGVRNDVGVISRGEHAYVVGVMTKDCPDLRFHADNAGSRAIMKVNRLLHDRWLTAGGRAEAGGADEK